MLESPGRVIAAVLGLAGFGIACVAGLASGHDAVTTLWRAIAAMAACYPVGLAIGRIAHVAVIEHVEAHRAANPMPPVPPPMVRPAVRPSQRSRAA